ncbi:MAG: endolytic transglycosylase MltG [Actinomycetota bacterium]|nr:endolytic transglycosylase MltG [Actinomycetota bacterium]
MSDIDVQDDSHDEPYAETYEPPRRRRRGGRGCVPALVIVLAFTLLAFFGGRWAVHQIKTRLSSAPDYSGPGTSALVFDVKKGETSVEIGRQLKAAGVVKSVDAFSAAAQGNPKSVDIQVGYYRLKKHMKAKEALAVLVNPKNLIQSLVLVREGARVRQIVASIVANTNINKSAVTGALKNPAAIGLPAAAHGNPEGYLYPATYTVIPGENAVQLLRQMVAATATQERHLKVAANAAKLGLSPEQALTVASILEYEANRTVDYPKVARVIYNRLKMGMPLQLDSTVSYVSGRSGDVWTTNAERANSSAYNTYAHTGLPPGPIGSPGQATMRGALHPVQGAWLYFVPDFATGTTHFSTTLAEHDKWVKKAQLFCQQSPKC